MQNSSIPINEPLTRPTTPLVLLFSQGFRPFFLSAAIWSMLALFIWMLVLQAGLQLPSRFDGMAWHQHEMMSGFVMAAITGFLLTAIPNWTGRPPVKGALLGILFALWLVGRVTCLIADSGEVARGFRDQVAHGFRFDVAHHSGMKSPTF